MAKRIDLRAYQENIAQRLATALSDPVVPALLGFESGGMLWLIDLPAAGEVLPLPELTPVPLTQAWFAGLANVHGELQSVIDFSLLCGGPATPRNAAARLLRIGYRLGSDAALLVGRIHGLRRADTLFASAESSTNHGQIWLGAAYNDSRGQRWTRLEPERLLADPRILDAALMEA